MQEDVRTRGTPVVGYVWRDYSTSLHRCVQSSEAHMCYTAECIIVNLVWIMFIRSLRHPPLLVLLAAVSIVVLVMMITRPSEPATRLISRWQPQPMVTQPDLPAARAAAPPAPITGAVVPLDAFELRVDAGLYPDERQPLADD